MLDPAASPEAHPVSSHKPRVLCVDDEPLSLQSLQAILRRRFEVVCASGGEAALQVLRDQPNFQVVVSDFEMPGMNGARFLRQVRDVSPESVRVLLTGRAGFSEAMQVINEGYVFRFLSKPCPPEVLIQALDEAVEQHRLRTADRVLMEQKVAEVSQQLLRAERLATLGTLATGVGHELANLTTVFLGMVGAVRENFEAQRLPERRDLEELERLGEHLRQHSKHLLNLGRPRADVVKVIDLTAVVSEGLDLLNTVGKIKRLEVKLVAPDEPLLVKASRLQLEQVLVNLMVNAADALELVRDRVARIEVTLWKQGDRIGCSIQDNGCGIPSDKLTAIFDAYFTTKPPGKGTGLGLPVVKQIIESYGSPMEVESKLDQGTTFRFFLPVSDAPEDLGPSLAPPPRPALPLTARPSLEDLTP